VRQQLGLPAARVDGVRVELRRERLPGIGHEQDAPVGKPSPHDRVRTQPREAGGRAATTRHHVHLGVMLLPAHQRQVRSIRREHGPADLTQVGREPLRCAPVEGHGPGVVLRDEHDGVARDGRIAEVAGIQTHAASLRFRSPMPDLFVATFTGRLEVLFEERRDPSKAVGMAAYMRDQFPYYGLPAPAQRAAAREALEGLGQPTEADLVQLATTCWARPQREWQYAACDLLARWAKHCSPAMLLTAEHLITTKSWWDTVDLLASKVFCTWVGDHR